MFYFNNVNLKIYKCIWAIEEKTPLNYYENKYFLTQLMSNAQIIFITKNQKEFVLERL